MAVGGMVLRSAVVSVVAFVFQDDALEDLAPKEGRTPIRPGP